MVDAGERIEINELVTDKAFKLLGAALFGDEEYFAEQSEAIRFAYTWGLSGFRGLHEEDWTINASRGIVGGRAERQYAVELGVLSGNLEPGDAGEGGEVRKFIDRFAATVLQRARDMPRQGPIMAAGGAAGLVDGPLMAQLEKVDGLERAHSLYLLEGGIIVLSVDLPSHHRISTVAMHWY